jgi:histidinol phosphatase-like enzyme
MIKKAMEKFDIDLEKSYMIGDHFTDLILPVRAILKASW